MKVATLEKLQETVAELKERILTKASTIDYTAILSTTWSGTAALYTQNVPINGVMSIDKPVIDVAISTTAWEMQETEWAKIVKAESYNGGIKFYAKEKTTFALPINVKIVRRGYADSNTLIGISITSLPTKTTYTAGDTLDLSGMVITATYYSGKTTTITGYTVSPAEGSILSTNGTFTVTVSYTENDVTETTSFTVAVLPKIVTWADGTDAEIADMVAAADRGEINLADYWAVGDTRTVNLSAMPATGVSESHVAQTVTMVLMNAGGKTLAQPTTGGRTTCNFIVGLKNGFSNGTEGEHGNMNPTDTNSGGWKNSARRTWCNSVFKNALPEELRDIFKPFINKSGKGSGTTSGTEDTTDTFALPAEIEIFGSTTYSVSGEGSQFHWYQTAANRIKKNGDNGSLSAWWTRSPRSGNSSNFIVVTTNDDLWPNSGASLLGIISPFGCI